MIKKIIVVASAILVGELAAQKQDILPGDEGIIVITPTPTVIEKFTSLRKAYPKDQLNWSEAYDENVAKKDPDEMSDAKVHIPILLGMRITDGVLTVMGRDAEQLDDAAVDIEKLAKKLNVSGSALVRAKKVKGFAKRGEWNRVYMELGFLQSDVMRTLNSSSNRGRKVLLISAGWLQGAHIVSGVIESDYKADKSTLLREPLLLKQLLSEINGLDAEKLADPKTKALKQAMTEILPLVDVPVHAKISKENVQKIHKITAAFRAVILN